MPPGEVIERLVLKPGMVVADIGAGTGFFALPFAGAVDPAGVVWAVDVQPAMLKMLKRGLRAISDCSREMPLIPVFRTALATWPSWQTYGMSWTASARFLRRCDGYCAPAGALRSWIGAATCRTRLDRRQTIALPPVKRKRR